MVEYFPKGNLRVSAGMNRRTSKKKEQGIRVKFHTTRALSICSWGCQKSKNATRPASRRLLSYSRAEQKDSKQTEQLGNVEPLIKTSMRVTKIIILNIHLLTIYLNTRVGRNGTFCERMNFS